MAAKKAKKRSSKKTKSADSFLIRGGLAIAVATAGLIVAFALVWWQVILEPAQMQRDAAREKELDFYAEFFDGRVTDLRNLVDGMATAPATVEALASYDSGRHAELAALLTSQNPYIKRVVIIEKGEAAVDLNAEVPISFAALDLIRRAETRPFVGPEVSLNQRNLIYTAQPITPDGVVAGVLLVVFDANFFLGPVSHLTSLRGRLEILQSFEGSPTQAVLSSGSESNLGEKATRQLAVPHWQVAYAQTADAAPLLDTSVLLLVPFLVAWGVAVGGIYLSFSMYARKLTHDTELLTDYGLRLLRGRSGRPGSFELESIAAVAQEFARQAGGDKDTVAAEATPDEDGDDLLAGLDEEDKAAAAKTKTAKEATKTDDEAGDDEDDYLDVRKSGDENFGIEVSEEVGPLDMGIDFDKGIFRAYDIRGITTSNLTEDVVYWIGRAFAAEALAQNQSRVAVGRDGRHSSEGLENSLTRGLTEGGLDVITIGQVPTPILYYATYALDTGTGIMITGSHNPPEYNGLKMMIGGTTLAEEKIQALYTRLEQNALSEGEGDVEAVDMFDSYVDRVLEDVAVAQAPKVVIDCGNGVAGAIAPRLFRELGCEVIELYCEVDGDFPNHHPDPADPANLEDLITVVQAEDADLGLAFDGDGDRLGVVTPEGTIIWPDKLMMLFAQDIVSRNPGADIIYDVKCSRHLNNVVSELGGRPIMWRTGHSHIKAKIKETGALLGGEFSGHICFAERWYGFDDALYSGVRLLEILGAESTPVEEVFAQFPETFMTPELKITTTESEKFEIMERLSAGTDFGEGTVTTIDGLRVDYADAWGLIRPSNTSPVLTLRFEADNQASLDRIQDEFQKHLHAIDSNLTFR